MHENCAYHGHMHKTVPMCLCLWAHLDRQPLSSVSSFPSLQMPDYTPSYTPLERSSGTYGSRTSLLNIQEAPVTSRYLQVQ